MQIKLTRMSFKPHPLTLVFVPGALLFLMGIAFLLAPRLIIGLVAAFCFFFGGLLIFLALKFIVLKKRMESVVESLRQRPLSGQIIVQQMPSVAEIVKEAEILSENLDEHEAKILQKIDQKKIILH